MGFLHGYFFPLRWKQSKQFKAGEGWRRIIAWIISPPSLLITAVENLKAFLKPCWEDLTGSKPSVQNRVEKVKTCLDCEASPHASLTIFISNVHCYFNELFKKEPDELAVK